MSGKILVTFGTKYGATAEIAERIAEELKKSGKLVDILNVRRVEDLSEYDTVVLGSALYMGFWRKEMTRFVKKQAAELAQKKVWIFASGTTNEGDPVKDLEGRIYPPNLQPAMDIIKPVDVTAFHGAIDMGKLSRFEKWVLKKVNAPIGDFRDWAMITEWAKTIIQ
jgi:menaquinone-dependent protoporphyrinogen oxidase